MAEEGSTTPAAELSLSNKAETAERRQVMVMFSDLIAAYSLGPSRLACDVFSAAILVADRLRRRD